jgi:hypothetical protein
MGLRQCITMAAIGVWLMACTGPLPGSSIATMASSTSAASVTKPRFIEFYGGT